MIPWFRYAELTLCQHHMQVQYLCEDRSTWPKQLYTAKIWSP